MLRHQPAERLEAEFSFRELDEERVLLGVPHFAQRDDVDGRPPADFGARHPSLAKLISLATA